MNDDVLMDRLSWQDYRDRLQAHAPMVLLPVGALEQHGQENNKGTKLTKYKR